MAIDLRKFNGGAREGAGRPKTINGYRQVAVRLPEDMARWVISQADKLCGGSEAEMLRRLIKKAMEVGEPDKTAEPRSD
jgi:hypothetical protein